MSNHEFDIILPLVARCRLAIPQESDDLAARNRAALVIPCHRVVPKAGGVGGYRWSPERKRYLIDLEAGA